MLPDNADRQTLDELAELHPRTPQLTAPLDAAHPGLSKGDPAVILSDPEPARTRRAARVNPVLPRIESQPSGELVALGRSNHEPFPLTRQPPTAATSQPQSHLATLAT